MTFALITEGISEHRIIKHILQKYFKEQEPDINQVQPKIAANKQEGTGGWNEVLSYCSDAEKLTAALIENDYLIIQIDTDQSQTSPFDISHTNVANEEKPVAELCTDVIAKLTGLMPPEIVERFSQRICFAICVHTIECWLLPIYSAHHKAATKSCMPKLNAALRRNNLDNIPTATKEKNSAIAIRTYDDILKNWKRKQDIIVASQYNEGFSRLITMLEDVAVAP